MKYERSATYRTEYIQANPPVHGKFYICAYCGKIVSKGHMEVDHIVSIDLANRRRLYRLMVPKDGINSLHNLTASCSACNESKGNRGGWWIIKGKVGRWYYAFVWGLFLAACLLVASGILSGILTPAAIRGLVYKAECFALQQLGALMANATAELKDVFGAL